MLPSLSCLQSRMVYRLNFSQTILCFSGSRLAKQVALLFLLYLHIGSFLTNLTLASTSSPPQPDLLNVKDEVPSVIIDLRYATNNNFVGKKLYKDSNAYLRKETIEALKKAVSSLEKQGFRLVVLDAYRPPSVQKVLFESTPFKEFVAPPTKEYNRHGRGTAIDVSLATMDGKPLKMPSKFDEFSDRADQDFSDVPEIAAKHGRILMRAFHQAGFSGLRKEWWHYDLKNWRDYAVIED